MLQDLNFKGLIMTPAGLQVEPNRDDRLLHVSPFADGNHPVGSTAFCKKSRNAIGDNTLISYGQCSGVCGRKPPSFFVNVGCCGWKLPYFYTCRWNHPASTAVEENHPSASSTHAVRQSGNHPATLPSSLQLDIKEGWRYIAKAQGKLGN